MSEGASDFKSFYVARCPKCAWRGYSGSEWEAADLLEIHKEDVHPWL